MRFVMFYHSLVSDWNHGNAHFLRGIAGELRGARPRGASCTSRAMGWSRRNCSIDHGPGALDAFARAYPRLQSQIYERASFDLERAVAGADVVIVHEMNEPELVNAARQAGREPPAGRAPPAVSRQPPPAWSRSPRRWPPSTLRATTACSPSARCWPGSTGARAAAGGPSSGTRRPTRACSSPARRPVEADLVWIGNWDEDERPAAPRVPDRAGAGDGPHRAGLRGPIPDRGAGRAGQARGSPTGAGCPTSTSPTCSPATG